MSQLWTAADLRTIDQMKVFTGPSSVAVYGSLSLTEGELLGSGTLLDLWGETFLLTADHVLRPLFAMKSASERLYIALACSKDDGETPGVLPTHWYGRPPPIDVAATSLGSAQWSSTRVPLASRLVAPNSAVADRGLLFIHGYPGARSRAFSFGTASKSLPYLSGPADIQGVSWFDPEVHFGVRYDPDRLIGEHGQPADFVDPHGLSGSAVWAVNGAADVDDWTPSHNARVIGIVTAWSQSDHALVATRIEVVRERLARLLRNRFAHARWEARSKPLGDDWADWFAAIDEQDQQVFADSWVAETFARFDRLFFDGRLEGGTVTAQVIVPRGRTERLDDVEQGSCKKDGSIIYLNGAGDHDWRYTLLHEMVHAFEYRFPGDIQPTAEGSAVERRYSNALYEPHSAAFFTKLFEVMRARGHDPEAHFEHYFG